MRLITLALLAALPPLALCQTEPGEMRGAPPRATPGDYQAQAKVGAFTIAADFAGHAVPTLEATYTTEDYVAVEVCFFGAPEAKLKLSIEDFSLKINDKKQPYTSQAFGYVAKSLKDPEWQPPEPEEKKSKTGINTGGGGDSTPTPPKMPLELRRAMELRVKKEILPEGDRVLPVAGLIFFQFRGKPQSIKQMELNYEGPAGKASLPLQP